MMDFKFKTHLFPVLSSGLKTFLRLVILFFLFVCGHAFSNESNHVLFVLSKDAPHFREVVKLTTQDWTDPESHSYTVLIQEEKTEIDRLLKKSDIIVTLGTSAANKILTKKPSKPLITTLITKSAFKSLAEKYFGDVTEALASGVSPILLDQPFERRLNLVRRILSEVTDVGIMLGPTVAEDISFYTDSIREKNLKAQMLLIDPDKNPIRQLDPVIKKSDAFIPIADSHLINVTTAKWILQLSYRYRVPVIGYSANYVDAGALASVFSSPNDVSRQTLDLIELLSNKDYRHQIHLPEYCTVKFNKTVAWHLNLKIPKELEKNTGRCDL